MPSFRQTIDIDTDPDATWAVVGDPASVKDWVPGLASVEVRGMTRICTLADGRVQHEQISDYSPETRSFRYAIDGGLPVRDNGGSFAVRERAGGSRVVWESSFEPLDPDQDAELTELWRGMLPVVLGNLKRLVEGRRLHGLTAE
ncbi:MAG: SRPBCC family protein [Solirubrobacteraceae bacterium]